MLKRTLVPMMMLALAAPGAFAHGGDRPAPPAKPAKAVKKVVLVQHVCKATVVSATAPSEGTAGSVVVRVARGNRHCRPLAGREVTLSVTAATRITKLGAARGSFADLTAGARVLVKVRAPKVVPAGATLVARQILVRPAVAPTA